MDRQRRYWHPMVGFNYRMTNVAAALGLAQMERIDRLLQDRKQIAAWYNERLGNLRSLVLPLEAAAAASAFWMYSILTPNNACRDSLMAHLADQRIDTRPLFYPLHDIPLYPRSPHHIHCPLLPYLRYRAL